MTMTRLLAAVLSAILLVAPAWAGSRTFGGVSTDKVVITAYAAINNLTTLSVSVWTFRTGAGGGGTGRILDKSTSANTGVVKLFTSAAFGYEFQFDRWLTTNGEWSITAPSDSAWHHLGVTYDYSQAAGTDPVVYLDGTTPTVTERETPSGSLGTGTEAFVIGNRSDDARNWAGSIAGVAMWNVVLTAAEMARLATGVSPQCVRPASLVLYVPLAIGNSPEPNPASAADTGTVTGTSFNANQPPFGPAPLSLLGAGGC
jgi:hypothetical protein